MLFRSGATTGAEYATGSSCDTGSNGACPEQPIGDAAAGFDYEANFGEAMKGAYFRYQGGLTTPPCTEGVEWVVFERPLRLNEGTIAYYLRTDDGQHGLDSTTKNDDIDKLIKATPTHIRNNRPTVAIHGRNIQYNKLLAIENDKTNGARYNYKRPDLMWSKKWADGGAASATGMLTQLSGCPAAFITACCNCPKLAGWSLASLVFK